jgi:hypothetical protein
VRPRGTGCPGAERCCWMSMPSSCAARAIRQWSSASISRETRSPSPRNAEGPAPGGLGRFDCDRYGGADRDRTDKLLLAKRQLHKLYQHPYRKLMCSRDTQWQHVAPCMYRRWSANLPANRPDCAPTVLARGFPWAVGLFIASGVLLPSEPYRARRRRTMRNAALDRRRAPTSPPAHSVPSSPAKPRRSLAFCPFERDGQRQAGSAPRSA